MTGTRVADVQGVGMDEDGADYTCVRPIGPLPIPCPRPGCTYVAVSEREGQAIRALAGHLIGAHMREAGSRG